MVHPVFTVWCMKYPVSGNYMYKFNYSDYGGARSKVILFCYVWFHSPFLVMLDLMTHASGNTADATFTYLFCGNSALSSLLSSLLKSLSRGRTPTQILRVSMWEDIHKRMTKPAKRYCTRIIFPTTQQVFTWLKNVGSCSLAHTQLMLSKWIR